MGRKHKRLRAVVVALVSLCVVMVAAAYVFAPQGQALAVGTPQVQYSSTLKGEYVHGWVHSANGNAISGAVVRISKLSGAVIKTVHTTSSGNYGMSLNVAKGSYEIYFHCDHIKAGTATLKLARNYRYDVNAQAEKKAKGLVVLPIFNY